MVAAKAWASLYPISVKRNMNCLGNYPYKALPFDDKSFDYVYGLSVLEHLLNPCQFLRETHRVLNEGGTLVILTPNISTFFTAALILMGKMPSSGPATPRFRPTVSTRRIILG